MPVNYRHADYFARRQGESDYAYQRRVGPYLHHREDAEADATQAHAEFRQQQEARQSGTGYGLAGDMTAQQRAQAVGTRGFGSGREIAKEGGIAVTAARGQVAIPRIYASEIHDDQAHPGVSPLLAHMRGDIVEWG
jgi:hypothetical protein